MALTIGGGGGGGGAVALYRNSNGSTDGGQRFLRRPILFPEPQFTSRNANLIAKAAKKSSSRTAKLDGKNRRSFRSTTREEEEQRPAQIETDGSTVLRGAVDVSSGAGVDDGYFLPELPGLEKDFWEGPQWDGLGFFVQYMWAFGIGFAILACGVAVTTYNEGATDFKQTPAYKESIQSKDLLEEPEGSSSDVFESNPTEEAPSLE